MTFATETWAAAWRWCSLRIASSAVVCCATRCASTAARTAERRGPYSRTRCSSCTTNAGWSCGGSGGGRPWPAASICATYASAARRAARASSPLLRQAAQVLDEGELEHARPGPQLADRERRHRLVAVHEAHELLPVEAAVAVADQLDGHGVDARVAGELAGGELGQLAVVAARQVLAHVADLGGDQVVVVEQPLRGRRDELPLVHVLGHGEVRLAQDARVVGEAREHVPRVSAAAWDRPSGAPRAPWPAPRAARCSAARRAAASRERGGGLGRGASAASRGPNSRDGPAIAQSRLPAASAVAERGGDEQRQADRRAARRRLVLAVDRFGLQHERRNAGAPGSGSSDRRRPAGSATR